MRSIGFRIGAGIVITWIGVAVFWSYFVPYDPNMVDPLNTLRAPTSGHPFGTDDVGRDVLSRVFAGAGSVLAVASAVTMACVIGGAVLGIATGYYRGVVDDVVMRLIDALISLPTIVIAVLVLGLLGPSIRNLIGVIACFFVPYVTRTVRSVVLSERERAYVEAARMRGENGFYIMLREILPNVTGPIVVEATIRFGFAVFAASSLSFLGLGLQRPSPDWGLTIAQQSIYLQIAPWTVLFPAAALATLLIGVSLVGEALQGVIAE